MIEYYEWKTYKDTYKDKYKDEKDTYKDEKGNTNINIINIINTASTGQIINGT